MTNSQGDNSDGLRTGSRLKRLAHFAALFRDPTTVFATMHPNTGKGTRDDSTILGWYELSEVGTRFFDMAYDAGWVVRDFDWSKWAWSEEGQRLCSDRQTLAKANCDELTKLLTAIIRQDRFHDGCLRQAFENGLLRAITERAEVLASQAEQR